MFHPLPRGFHCWVAIAAVLIAVIATWPVAAHLSDHVVDGARLVNPKNTNDFWSGNIGADVLLTTWVVNWDLHALVTQPLHLFDANIFYPAPLPLARSEHLFGIALLALPGRLLGGPVVAHQSALLLCSVLNVWGTAYAVTRWTGSLGGGLVAGLLLAVSPFHQHNPAHIQSVATGYLPLLLLALEGYVATGAPRWAAAGAAGLLLQMLSGQYLAYYALVVWLVGGAVLVLVGRPAARPLPRLARDVGVLAAASTAATLMVVPFVIPYLRLGAEVPSNVERGLFFTSVLSLRSYLLTGSFPQTWLHVPQATWALAVLGTVALALGGRFERARVVALVLVGLAGALLSLGPKPGSMGLYRLAVDIFPGFRTVREPDRASVLVFVALALLSGCGAAALLRRLPRLGPPLVLGLTALSFVSSWHGPTLVRPMAVGAELPGAYRFLARCGGGDPLLELPIYSAYESWREAEREFYSTYHWLPLLNGRSGYPPPLYLTTIKVAAQLPDAAALASLRETTAVRWVLVHCDQAAGQPTRAVHLCSPEPPPGMSKPRVFGDTLLYDLGPARDLPRPWPARWPTPADCALPEPTPGR